MQNTWHLSLKFGFRLNRIVLIEKNLMHFWLKTSNRSHSSHCLLNRGHILLLSYLKEWFFWFIYSTFQEFKNLFNKAYHSRLFIEVRIDQYLCCFKDIFVFLVWFLLDHSSSTLHFSLFPLLILDFLSFDRYFESTSDINMAILVRDKKHHISRDIVVQMGVFCKRYGLGGSFI